MPGNTLTCQDLLLALKPGESLQSFALRIIPRGMRLAHAPVKGDFGPGKGNIVVLFHSGDTGFQGWVLVPEFGKYRKYVLPFDPLLAETEVKAVFFEYVQRDDERELLILCKHVSGVGRYPGNLTPFCNTYAFTWNQDGFAEIGGAPLNVDGCSSARVRRELKRVPN